MAEYGDERQDQGDDSADETIVNNNTIIGMVRSSVSSLSKWFSPSNNNNNDSANGRHSSVKRTYAEAQANTPQARVERSEMVRRRIEVSDYAEDEDDGDGDDLEDQEGDESNHSDDDDEQTSETDQPIVKRRRKLDSTMLSSRPLIASTPAMTAPQIVNNHYGPSNLFSDPNRNEMNYNFYSSMASTSNYEQQNVAPDIIDLIPIPISSSENDTLNARKRNRNIDHEASRSRRTLNIPPTTILPPESSFTRNALPSLKRQSIKSVKGNITATDSSQNVDSQCYERKNQPIVLDPTLELDEVLLTTESYNGGVQSKFQNGATDFEGELRQRSDTDSETEYADTATELPTNALIHSGLKSSNPESQRSERFNMSTGNSRSGSRASSFGNGLNFYTNLEGRKSLFSGGNNLGNRTNLGNPLNSSTLSLNSLSRRQFNASIYGSTSALSDSRLLNTSSPFYKGNTTYGGAAAYRKYATSLGSNSCLIPTLIRPTSSLSTLSTSSNSIQSNKTILDMLQSFTTPLSEAKKMASGIRQQQLQSKRLCDDDLKASRAMRLQHVSKPYARKAVLLQPKTSSASKAEPIPPVRELQVPSMSQLLQLKKMQSVTERSRQITMQKSNNMERRPISTQVSISKTNLKKIETQNQQDYNLPSTGASIEQQHIEIPVVDVITRDDRQQKHVNKIKNKIASALRTGPDISEESPPAPANLPNIAFPLMSNMPKIDIPLTTITKNCITSSEKPEDTQSLKPSKPMDVNFEFSLPEALKNNPIPVQDIAPSTMNFEFSKPIPIEKTSDTEITTNDSKMPSEVSSPALTVAISDTATATATKSNELKSQATLKTGSVLDALKKPVEKPKLSNSIETINPISNSLQPLSAFGNQYKKAANEWECDTCMLRNKESAQKCVACEVPRKGAVIEASSTKDTTGLKSLTTATTNVPIATDSGFKSLAAAQKASNWECEACMTQNDMSRPKCVCCEQPKPGSESTKENAPKFAFGATAAAKFSFGFNAGAPDPAKQNASLSNHLDSSSTNATSAAKTSTVEFATTGKGFTFGAGAATATTSTSKSNEGFSFGLQTKASSETDKISSAESKDTSDSSIKTTSGFNFGFGNSGKTISTPSANTLKEHTPATTSAATTANVSTTSTPTTTTTKQLTTESTFAVPKVSSFTSGSARSTTSVDSTATATTKRQAGSPFGLSFQKVSSNSMASTASTTTAASNEEGKLPFPLFKTAPMGTGISSTTAATTTSIPTATVTSSSSSATSTFSAATTANQNTAAVAPTFSFGVVSTSATSTTSMVKPMISFGTNQAHSTITKTEGVALSSTTPITIPKANETGGFQFTHSNTNATTTKSPFSLNNNNNNTNATFATFGSPKNNPEKDISTATKATAIAPTFGSFSFGGSTAAKTESTNLFGLSASKTQGETKPAALAAPIFGNASAQAEPKTTTSNPWPKNAFLFGASAAPTPATETTISNANANVSNEHAQKLVFGSAKSSISETSPIFGSVGATSSTPVFGNSGNASTSIFGSNENTAAATTNTNIFGSNNNNSAIPQFGAGSIGSAQQTTLGNTSANSAHAFGSSASIGFGSFGVAAVTTVATSTTITQPAAPSFAFGATQTQPTHGGFNFGSTASTTKPAFNFSSTNQPTFNFTGSSTETSQNSTRPFQFGATAVPSVNAPPVFSFGSAPPPEATSNTPFQFNAGPSQAAGNIFAPTPSTQQTPTQAPRRKVRAPNRRLQQR